MSSNSDAGATIKPRPKQQKLDRGHEITCKTIKTPQFSYACLQLISESPTANESPLDSVTVRSYVGSALSQFLGLSGSAVSVDVLKFAWKVMRRSMTESALQVFSPEAHSIPALLISLVVFSAPRYCDSTENKGAYINIGPEYKLEFHKFDAVPHPNIKPMVCPSLAPN